MKSISPLRYPGGKSRLYEQIVPLVMQNNSRSYAEPFSGGFGIGLLLLQNNIVDEVYINDLDKNIYSFWKCIKSDANHLIKEVQRVSTFDTPNQWLAEREVQLHILHSNVTDYRAKGFATLFLNRVNRSGILKGGPIGGISQEGNYKINCRFNALKLIEKINLIASYKDKIHVSRKKYQTFLTNLHQDVFIFLDPPYVVKGGCLYMNNFKTRDHQTVEKYLRNLPNPWVMTYDADDLIRNIYSNEALYAIEEFSLNHYAGKFKEGQELLISPVI